MTIHAIGLTTLSNTAKDFRNDMSSLLFGATATRPTGARSGVRYGTPTTTVSLSGFNGTIKPHSGVMDVQTAAAAGPYFYAVTANETFTVTAAHATLPRVDIVTIRINDDVEDSSGLESATAHYKAGTAAASPVAPSPDTTREMIIATIAVPASGGGDPVASWVALTAVAGGGIIPVRTTTERDALQTAYPGTTDAPLVVWVKSALEFQANYGTGWGPLAPATSHWARPANAAALAALTGMAAGYTAWQIDTGVEYYYSGSAWLANMPGLNIIIPTSVAGTGVSVSSGGAVTVTAATAASINGCFTSRFANYLVVMDCTTSAASGIDVTLRAAGTNATTAYDNQRFIIQNATATAAQSLNSSAIITAGGIGIIGARISGQMTVMGPAVAAATAGEVQTTITPNPMTTSAGKYVGGFLHRTATAYDGISFTPGAGNITGTIRVYGYNNG